MPRPKPKIRIQSFKEFLAEQELDHIVIEVPVTLIGAKALLNEGKWMPSEKNGWMVRVDAANPAIKQQRHGCPDQARQEQEYAGVMECRRNAP